MRFKRTILRSIFTNFKLSTCKEEQLRDITFHFEEKSFFSPDDYFIVYSHEAVFLQFLFAMPPQKTKIYTTGSPHNNLGGLGGALLSARGKLEAPSYFLHSEFKVSSPGV